VGASQLQRTRVLEAENARLLETARGTDGRERSLQATIAQQSAQLRQRDSELEMLRRQIETVEIQLDGVDALSQQLRATLGLKPGAGTWSDNAGDPSPQGGAYSPMSNDSARLALIQRRLAAGVGEIYKLSAAVHAKQQADGGAAAAEVDKQVPSGPPANWPARGLVTSDFGWRIFGGLPNFHTGVDIAVPYGTPVQATATGLVVGSGWQPGYGWCVLIQHDGGYHTLYAHLSSSAVQLGDATTPGQTIAYSGSSGNSTGPHLHYEVWHDGQAVDPRPFMDGTGSP
jgi:murein DD-endopeptidase MepM/ murein hydrolase activator NlpD